MPASGTGVRPFGGQGKTAPGEPPIPPEGYGRRLLHTDPSGRFSIWVMAWAEPVHDHACWCAFGLYRGRLVDERFRLDAGLRPVGHRTCGPGDADALPAGLHGIHRMCNPGATPALSVHVYGFDPARRASSLGRSYAG